MNPHRKPTLEDLLAREYPAQIYHVSEEEVDLDSSDDSEAAEDTAAGYYIAFLPDFGESACSAAGDSKIEALANLDEVKKGVFEHYLETGRDIPEPSPGAGSSLRTYAPTREVKEYVLGFCFSPDLSKVVLIAKTRPTWQAGKLNGLGGHIERDETPEVAMRREFFAESLCPDVIDWKEFGVLSVSNSDVDSEVHLFCGQYYTSPIYNETDEGEVSVHHCSILRNNVTSKGREPLPDLRWLIPMAINHLTGADHHCYYIEIEE